MPVVLGAVPDNAPRASTTGTQPHAYDTMSQPHALGEQWIEEVTDVDIVQTPPEECLEGEHLKFKADIRGEGTLPKPVGKT